jgi:DNA-binding protein HU-beta
MANKKNLIDMIAEKSGLLKKDSEKFLNSFIESVKEELANNGEVALTGFGKFSVVEKAERQGRNPKTSEPITIPAKKAPKFKAGKELRGSVLE